MALDQTFDADTLADLRKAVLAVATAVGMPDHRAAEVMLAVHELAANAVRHGAGAGRARLRVVGGELHCQVSDAGPGSLDGDAHGVSAGEAPSWPVKRGHGLWLVRNAADQVSIASGPSGSAVTVVFALSGFRDGKAGAQGYLRLVLPLWYLSPGNGTLPRSDTSDLVDLVQRARSDACEVKLGASLLLDQLTGTCIRLAGTLERSDLVREQGRRTVASSRAAREHVMRRQGAAI